MSRDWKSGDVLAFTLDDATSVEPEHIVALMQELIDWWSKRPKHEIGIATGTAGLRLVQRVFNEARIGRLVVIDAEDREQVERLMDGVTWLFSSADVDTVQAALREFANPTPSQPTDPTARVSDRRDNIWRLLADGDWVCTSGPDIGEYLDWSGLTERGPLTVEVNP